jgi:hypothetical protein
MLDFPQSLLNSSSQMVIYGTIEGKLFKPTVEHSSVPGDEFDGVPPDLKPRMTVLSRTSSSLDGPNQQAHILIILWQI